MCQPTAEDYEYGRDPATSSEVRELRLRVAALEEVVANLTGWQMDPDGPRPAHGKFCLTPESHIDESAQALRLAH